MPEKSSLMRARLAELGQFAGMQTQKLRMLRRMRDEGELDTKQIAAITGASFADCLDMLRGYRRAGIIYKKSTGAYALTKRGFDYVSMERWKP